MNKLKNQTVKLMSFSDMLVVALIVLKLMGKITWSWWWVLAPFWAPIVLVLFIIIVGILFLGVAELLK